MPVREIADGCRVGALTREDIIEALQEYARLYGDAFTAACFTPSGAKWGGRPELRERYYQGRPDGRRWPSLNAIKAQFDGSFNAAREAAGFEPNKTGPPRDRRAAGTAAPIRDVVDHVVYLPSEKAKQERERAERLAARLERALVRARRAEQVIVEMRERRAPVARVARGPARAVKTVTKTKTVKVRDERAVERLRAKLADEQAARRAVEDQSRASTRDRDRASDRAVRAEAELADMTSELRQVSNERARLTDQLQVARERVERLRGELVDAQAGESDVRERALAADFVRVAEERVEEAELRAARAERQAAEQGAAVTGEMRVLTQAELVELRAKGPAGPAVLAHAFRKLARARSETGGDLDAALVAVARAAMTWRDVL